MVEIVYSEFASACSGEIACSRIPQYSDIQNFPEIIEKNPYQKYQYSNDDDKYRWMLSTDDPNNFYASYVNAGNAKIRLNCDQSKKVCSTTALTRRKFIRGRVYSLLLKIKTKSNTENISKFQAKLGFTNEQYLNVILGAKGTIFIFTFIIFFLGIFELMEKKYVEWISINRQLFLMLWLQMSGIGVLSFVMYYMMEDWVEGVKIAEFLFSEIHLALNYYFWITIFEFIWKSDSQVVGIIKILFVSGITISSILREFVYKYTVRLFILKNTFRRLIHRICTYSWYTI